MARKSDTKAARRNVNYGARAIPSANARKHVASLTKRYGATRVTAILNGSDPEAKNIRSAKLFPEDVNVSLPTVLGIAEVYGVKLARGRRPNAA